MGFEGRFEHLGSPIAGDDTVHHIQIFLLSHVLDLVDELAGESFLHQFLIDFGI